MSDGTKRTFDEALKYTGGAITGNWLKMHFPEACKIIIYSGNLGTEGNFRIRYGSENYSKDYVINGDVRYAVGTFMTYSWDIPAAGDYRIGTSSAGMGQNGFYIYAIEVIF